MNNPGNPYPPGNPPPGQGFGALPAQQQGFGAPPPQQQFGAPPPQQQFGAPPPQQQFGAQPPQQGFGAQPPQQGFGAPPPQQGFGGPPPQQGFGGPPQQGFGAPMPPQPMMAGGMSNRTMDGYHTCPRCNGFNVSKPTYTWWGGWLGPKIISVVKCNGCGHTYNGKTGGSNAPYVAIYMAIVWTLVIGITIAANM